MQRWKLIVEYDGTGLAGWQLQPGATTVQGLLEGAAEQILGHPVRVHGAGRTDAGVHARHQVAVLDARVARPVRAIRDGLNAHLPPGVAVVHAAPAQADFDPRRAPHTKTYRYRWLVRAARSPLRRDRVWHLRRELDAEAMDRAARTCEGTHDFTSLRASGCGATHATRTVVSSRVHRVDDEVHLVVQGTGFLRHMIRILAGTLLEVGQGKRPPAWVAEVLQARDRSRAGRTAPACGLVLDDIVYDEE